MTGRILTFPLAVRPYTGTICVMGNKAAGFQVGHESVSGNSWGSFSGPYQHGQEAIAAAHALNRDTYFGGCNVSICDAALHDNEPDTAPLHIDGTDF